MCELPASIEARLQSIIGWRKQIDGLIQVEAERALYAATTETPKDLTPEQRSAMARRFAGA
jgi:hypothetical protein